MMNRRHFLLAAVGTTLPGITESGLFGRVFYDAPRSLPVSAGVTMAWHCASFLPDYPRL